MRRTAMDTHIARVEAEYGEPFLEIVKGYADDGESRTSTAAILDIPGATFRRWLTKQDGIEWRKPTDTNPWRDGNKNKDTTNVVIAARVNLHRAREANNDRWKNSIIRTPGIIERITEARGKGVSWLRMPKHLGIKYNPTSLRQGYMRHTKPLTRQ